MHAIYKYIVFKTVKLKTKRYIVEKNSVIYIRKGDLNCIMTKYGSKGRKVH